MLGVLGVLQLWIRGGGGVSRIELCGAVGQGTWMKVLYLLISFM